MLGDQPNNTNSIIQGKSPPLNPRLPSRPGWTQTVEVRRRQGVQACCNQPRALPMALAIHCQLNPQVRPFVPMVMAPKLAYRRGKRDGGEEPVSKRQIRSGEGRWEGRRGVGWLNPRRETKTKGRDGDRKRGMREKFTNRGGEAEQSGAFCDSAKGGIEHVRVDGKSQLPRTTYGQWRWMGSTELNAR